MRTTIISDIHANLEALLAVLEDISKQNVDRIICLGDLVDYGPDPAPCVDKIEELQQKGAIVILGNHDLEHREDDVGYSFKGIRLEQWAQPIQRKAGSWTLDQVLYAENIFSEYNVPTPLTRRLLKLVNLGRKPSFNRINFLRTLPFRHDEGDVTYAHGCPIRGIEPIIYFIPWAYYEGLGLKLTIDELFNEVANSFERLCFIGHTHIPSYLGKELVEVKGKQVVEIPEAGEKVIFNVGSVGQPRDNDNRACYVIYDSNADTVEYRRIPYDYKATQKKIYQRPVDELEKAQIKLGIPVRRAELLETARNH